MKRLLSFFLPKAPIYLVYMLQQVEYDPNVFLRWAVRFPQLNHVMHRQQLTWSNKARLLILFTYVVAISYAFGVILASISALLFLLLVLLTPLVAILLLYILVMTAWVLIEKPRRKLLIKQSEAFFKDHSAIKIAIAGSYGKTSMKELLLTALCPDKKVAATPGNENVSLSHARWVAKLDGDEDVLLIEYGEDGIGDIEHFAQTTHPDIGIITGLAPNHLDHYGSLEAVAKDLFSLADYLNGKEVYVNAEPEAIKPYLQSSYQTYNQKKVLGWAISNSKITIKSTSFVLRKGKETIRITSGLLGRHQVGPLGFAAALSHKLGLSIKQIETNLAQTVPYEHRMQPRFVSGAWIIDDAYNGNVEGFRAGLELLKEVIAKRKIYVTPGLVDQGKESERVHFEIGQLIAKAKPDQVILMRNSVTNYIAEGLQKSKYQGQVDIRTDPLEFYTNLDQYVAAGDLVMLQNDWTDNYH